MSENGGKKNYLMSDDQGLDDNFWKFGDSCGELGGNWAHLSAFGDLGRIWGELGRVGENWEDNWGQLETTQKGNLPAT